MPSGFRKEGGFSGVTFEKGLVPWNKGKPASDDMKEILRTVNLGRTPWNKKDSNVQCEICSKVFHRKPCHIKRVKSNYCSAECRNIGQKIRWESIELREKMRRVHYRGISPLVKLIKGQPEYKTWRESVFKRDNYSCQECGLKSGNGHRFIIHPHHKKPFSIILKEFLNQYSQFSPMEDKDILSRLSITYSHFWDINNGQTLCKDCHKNTDTYGVNINKKGESK
jgi:5-methylcytosine-specific restriction endonuclease McrA